MGRTTAPIKCHQRRLYVTEKHWKRTIKIAVDVISAKVSVLRSKRVAWENQNQEHFRYEVDNEIFDKGERKYLFHKKGGRSDTDASIC